MFSKEFIVAQQSNLGLDYHIIEVLDHTLLDTHNR